MVKNNKQLTTKIRINDNLEMDVNEMLPINSIEDLGEVDTFDEFFKYTDDALNGKQIISKDRSEIIDDTLDAMELL